MYTDTEKKEFLVKLAQKDYPDGGLFYVIKTPNGRWSIGPKNKCSLSDYIVGIIMSRDYNK